MRQLAPLAFLLPALLPLFAGAAESLLAPTPLAFDSPADFRPPPANWHAAGGFAGDPRHDKTLTASAGSGILINDSAVASSGDLVTAWNHQDLDLDLDFLLPAGGSLEVLCAGRYPVPLDQPAAAGAFRAAGLWQHLHVEFRSPAAAGGSTTPVPAHFAQISLNHFVVAENLVATAAAETETGSATDGGGPLVIHANHPVALRNVTVKRYLRDAVRLDGLVYEVFPGSYKSLAEIKGLTAARSGPAETFSPEMIQPTGRFALIYTGRVIVPRDGIYAFGTDARDAVQLSLEGQRAISPVVKGSAAGTVTLTAGPHAFVLEYLHGSTARPALELTIEGPGVPAQSLGAPPPVHSRRATAAAAPKKILIQPVGTIRLQRSFVPFEPSKRLYAINVGTPAGIHYAYDFETGAILRVWRSDFLDTEEMWDGRGENQIAKPAGPALTLNARPAVALLERASADWPVVPEPLYTSQGYILEPDGQPVFLSKLASLVIRDRIAPASSGAGLTRTLQLTGKNSDWETWVLLAEAPTITPQPKDAGYIIGDREYYIDVARTGPTAPLVRTRNGRQQLVVPVGAATLGQPVVYTLVW